MGDNITVRVAVRCSACDHDEIDGAEINGFGTDAELERMVGDLAADAVERIVEDGHFRTHAPKELRWRVVCPRHPGDPIRGTTMTTSGGTARELRTTGFEAVESLVEALRGHRIREHSIGAS